MDGMREVEALWAWFGKEPGSRREYSVLHCSGGPDKARVFEGYIRSSAPGNPPTGVHAGGDRLPWITVNGRTGQGERWIGVSCMENSKSVDGGGRAIVPTRYFMMQYDDTVPCGATYLTLWDAVETLPLPPEGSPAHVPVRLAADRHASALIGLARIADALASPAAAAEAGRRQTAAAHWAAAVAACVLAGDRVVITGAAGLGLRERLSVLDAVVGFLPYGLRSDLAVGSCVEGMRPPRTDLTFGPEHTPGARRISLGRLPADPAAGGEFRERLRRLIDGSGYQDVLGALAEMHEPLRLTDRSQILHGLAPLDPLRRAVWAVAVSPGQSALDDPDELATTTRETLRVQWKDPRTSQDVTAHVVEKLLAPGVDSAAHGEPGAAGSRRQLLWQFAVQCKKDDEVLRALFAHSTREPALEHTAQVVECLRLLGPEPLHRSGHTAAALRDAPWITLALLYAEAADAQRLRSWLTLARPWDLVAEPWLRAWQPLIVPEAEIAGLGVLSDVPATADAVLVLAAAARAGAGTPLRAVVRFLWKALLRAAREDGGPDGGPAAQEQRGRRRALLGLGSAQPKDAFPDALSVGVGAPTLRELLEQPHLWAECQARADALRCLAGGQPVGPGDGPLEVPRYGQDVEKLFYDEYLRPDLRGFVTALTSLAMRGKPGDPVSGMLMNVLQRVPPGHGRDDVAGRFNEWLAAHMHAPVHPGFDDDLAVDGIDPVDPWSLDHSYAEQDAAAREKTVPQAGALPAAVPDMAALQLPVRPASPGVSPPAQSPPQGPQQTGEQTEASAQWNLLCHAVSTAGSPQEVARAWAPVAVGPSGERSLVLVGNWWGRTTASGRRHTLLDHLLRELVEQRLLDANEAHELVDCFVVLIVSERASGRLGSGWHGRTHLKWEKHRLKWLRRRYRRLRRARLRSYVPLPTRRRSKHSKPGKPSKQRKNDDD
ncbi:hypothetical protein [Streptomyces sp. MUM 178J]|uniref:hypothetical protein n=1 Tax=Streptomyces sp. MUM 178J TaxID=2791991 RepID=UPI001F04D350|nr:hypothetical protein [Streptomyces sp. MUM 178J]WRQ80417.1 hypothetical protein I3F59_014265 [Streptomyces sp. MUM 178J]